MHGDTFVPGPSGPPPTAQTRCRRACMFVSFVASAIETWASGTRLASALARPKKGYSCICIALSHRNATLCRIVGAFALRIGSSTFVHCMDRSCNEHVGRRSNSSHSGLSDYLRRLHTCLRRFRLGNRSSGLLRGVQLLGPPQTTSASILRTWRETNIDKHVTNSEDSSFPCTEQHASVVCISEGEDCDVARTSIFRKRKYLPDWPSNSPSKRATRRSSETWYCCHWLRRIRSHV